MRNHLPAHRSILAAAAGALLLCLGLGACQCGDKPPKAAQSRSVDPKDAEVIATSPAPHN